MMVDGSLSGAGDGFARALAEERYEDIPQDMLNGFVGGLIASPFIGGGFRLVGKTSSTILNKINNKITFSSVLPDGTSTKFGQGQVGDCPLLSMIDGFLSNDRTKSLLTNAIQTDVNGNFAVKIGDKTVIVLRSSLTDEMLADKTGIRIFEQAYKQIAGDLDGGFADVVAKHFGLILKTPWVDEEIVKLAINLEFEDRKHKQILKDNFKNIIPDEIINREKRPLKNDLIKEDKISYRKKLVKLFYELMEEGENNES
jgi:hypothetical protein